MEPKVSCPVTDSACKMPMVAEELWMENATPAPARKPSSGLSARLTNSCANFGDCDSGSTAAVMFISPVKRMPKPIAIVPMVSELRKRKAMISNMPRMAASGSRVEGLKTFRKEFAPAFRSSKRMIWPVTVVPTFAPRMMPMDWCSVMMPAPTSPDVRTIVAVELWMTAVTQSPSRKPTMGLFVTLPIAFFSAPDEPCFSPSPIMRIP